MPLLKLLSRLPLPVLYYLSNFLFFFSYKILGYRTKVVRRNLKNSFREKTGEELMAIEQAFYKNLCDYAVETLKLLTINRADLKARMNYTNPELMEKYTAQGRSVILLSSHQFNWEWLLAAGSISLDVPIDFVYQPINNKLVDKVMQYGRSRFGAHPIKRNEVAREVAKRKKILRGVAIVADQYPGHESDKKYQTTFLHQDTVFFYGSQQMATLTQYPVLYAVVERVKRGYYTCTLQVVGEPPYQKGEEAVIENYVRAVEHVIQKHPSGWLWSHNRWKKRHLVSKQ
jgi:Kdo2-lipid IVA lauroyltransferase/acyltransferase